jgi:hypothetical protein
MTTINLKAYKAYKTDQRIIAGAEKCVDAMEKISKGDPWDAVGMMLLATAILAKVLNVPQNDLQDGFDIACNQCYGEE